jgi:hypothetical protein
MEINEKINEHEKYYLNKLCEVLIWKKLIIKISLHKIFEF